MTMPEEESIERQVGSDHNTVGDGADQISEDIEQIRKDLRLPDDKVEEACTTLMNWLGKAKIKDRSVFMMRFMAEVTARCTNRELVEYFRQAGRHVKRVRHWGQYW